MPDGVASKGTAKVKADKPKTDKGKTDKSKTERKQDGIFQRIAKFVRESYYEVFKKAKWPTWPELKKSTAVVIAVILIVMLWIGGWAFIFSKLGPIIRLSPK
jgi:preprotein translocase SecE subunit